MKGTNHEVEPSPLPINFPHCYKYFNIFLRILFSNILRLYSFDNVCGHVSQPHSTTGNITVLHILIFKF